MEEYSIYEVSVLNPEEVPIKITDSSSWNTFSKNTEETTDIVPEDVMERFASGEYGELLHDIHVYKTPKAEREIKESLREELGIDASKPITVGGAGWKRKTNYAPMIYKLLSQDTQLKKYLEEFESLEDEHQLHELKPEWDPFFYQASEEDEEVWVREIPDEVNKYEDTSLGLALEQEDSLNYNLKITKQGPRVPRAIGGGHIIDELVEPAEIELSE